MHKHKLLGNFTQTFAGRVSNDAYVLGSSSGGLTSWLLSKLVQLGIVDGVINVGAAGEDAQEIFRYSVATESELRNRRKSQYYATTMADVLELIKDEPKRYVLVGVPCYIKAARAMCKEDPKIAQRLVFFVALVCGHMKTQAYAESLAWQVGVPPHDLEAVDFRVKGKGRLSSDYDFGALKRGETEMRVAPMSTLQGGNWGHNTFQPEACNFCDDVVGETADISFGDAWLAKFTSDPRGTNIVISRNRRIDEIFACAADANEITLHEVSADEAVASQAGGFRHRRDGLAVRLADDIAAGLSVPVKRVSPNVNAVDKQRANLFRQRRRIAKVSQELFYDAVLHGDLRVYLKGLKREIVRYERLESFRVRMRRALRPVKLFLNRIRLAK
ncbi:Coenzyme F420 hydrogenase/dehydrogenase, beta subunit C-terminal domain [Stenotrophomonas koreensis]|uniref:Coenzyme F420 hydrogenase/dehydrogenase, beta subunit C-terminal domain n=1 Tax=Stenotrophomonas koreensis TaxID=266128 RepID=UPI0009F88B3B|nr:Coenzyme F420 hydrogenase/dehydrogenase, beta subunit C-terminal domain [Stenotrophomonas koreensis]